jgi:hypothetical protein
MPRSWKPTPARTNEFPDGESPSEKERKLL